MPRLPSHRQLWRTRGHQVTERGPEPCNAGVTLTELVVVTAILILATGSLALNLRPTIEQSRVDALTSRLQGALNSLRRQSLTYQTSCDYSWSLPSSNGSLSASADLIGTRLVIGATSCAFPTGTPRPRLSPPLRAPDDSDVLVTIQPTTFTITAFGGLNTAGDQPLLLRIRANRSAQNGDFERCLRMEPITAALMQGTWVGGNCRRNR